MGSSHASHATPSLVAPRTGQTRTAGPYRLPATVNGPCATALTHVVVPCAVSALSHLYEPEGSAPVTVYRKTSALAACARPAGVSDSGVVVNPPCGVR